MQKKPNNDLTKRLNKLTQFLDINALTMSKKVDMPHSTIYNYLKGERQPTSEFLMKICTNLNVNPQWLLKGEGEMFTDPNSLKSSEMVDIPIRNCVASAGAGCFIDYFQMPRKYLVESLKASPNQCDFIHAHGRSMEPTILDNDLVLIDKSQKRPVDGYLYCIRKTNNILIKEIQVIENGKVRLISHNKDYEPFIISIDDTLNVEIIGRVVWYGRKA